MFLMQSLDFVSTKTFLIIWQDQNQNRSIVFQLYVNNAAYVYNEETGEIEMLSQVDSVDDLQVRILPNTAVHCFMIYDLAPNKITVIISLFLITKPCSVLILFLVSGCMRRYPGTIAFYTSTPSDEKGCIFSCMLTLQVQVFKD